MSIKGLTDNDSGFGSGLPLIGRWFKGDPKETKTRRDGKEYTSFGKDLDHWRVEFEPGYEHLKELWVEMYGDEPDFFENIFLCGDTVDEAFPTWMEEYDSKQTLIHKCDGEDQVRHWNGSQYITAKVSCVKSRDADGKQTGCACKQTGRLMVAVPEFIEASGVIGQMMITTHSINDILTVYRILKTLEKRIGRVSGIPFTLGRSDKEISAPKQEKGSDGKYHVNGRVKVTKSLFYLYPDPAYTREVLLPAMTQLALPAPAPRVITPDMSKTLGSGDRPRILGRDNVVTLPSQTPTDGANALQPAPEPTPTPAPLPEVKPTGDWATGENLDLLFKTVRGQLGMPDMTDREIAGLVKITDSDVRSKKAWDNEFISGQIAGVAIVAAFEAMHKTPAPPPPQTPPAKTSAIVRRAMYQTAIEGKQRSARFVFDVEGMAKQPRVYGRENMKKLLKDAPGYYEANHFEEMHELVNMWYEIAPLEIEWDVIERTDPNTGEDRSYLMTTKATPVKSEESPAIIETPSALETEIFADKPAASVNMVVDTETGEIGFVSAPPPVIDGNF